MGFGSELFEGMEKRVIGNLVHALAFKIGVN